MAKHTLLHIEIDRDNPAAPLSVTVGDGYPAIKELLCDLPLYIEGFRKTHPVTRRLTHVITLFLAATTTLHDQYNPLEDMLVYEEIIRAAHTIENDSPETTPPKPKRAYKKRGTKTK